MADTLLHLDIITPQRTVVSMDVDSVEAPGIGGEFQVLAGHTPFLTGLKTGHIYYSKSGERNLIVISGGFFEVRENRAVILAHTAETKKEIDLERAQAAKDRAEKRIAEKNNPDIDLERAEAALIRAINRISALE